MADDGVVSVVLTNQTDKAIVYGDATLAIYEGFMSLDVVGHYMPDLSSFGPQYKAYGFLVLDPTAGTIITRQRMTLVHADVNTWAGSFELGLPPHGFGGGVVVVYPVAAGGGGQVIAVLQGALQNATI
jgi:hypothetical protein